MYHLLISKRFWGRRLNMHAQTLKNLGVNVNFNNPSSCACKKKKNLLLALAKRRYMCSFIVLYEQIWLHNLKARSEPGAMRNSARQKIQLFWPCGDMGHIKRDWRVGATTINCFLQSSLGFPGGSHCEDSAGNTGDVGSIPELARSPGEGNGSSLQCSCLEIPRTEEPGGPQSIALQRVGHN